MRLGVFVFFILSAANAQKTALPSSFHFFLSRDTKPGEVKACYGESLVNSSSHVCSTIMQDTPSIQSSAEVFIGGSMYGLLTKEDMPPAGFQFSTFASKLMPKMCTSGQMRVVQLEAELAMVQRIARTACDLNGTPMRNSGGNR